MKARSRDALALGLALAAAWLAHRYVLDLALVGWDTYPILAASDPRDLPAALVERWMGGRYPLGDFYRPLSTLSFALDRALWGLAPRGYQLGNLLTLLFATGCSYGLARAWLGHRAAAGFAALCFALHAALLEVVPVTARRSDLLAAGWMAAALWAQPLSAGRAPGRQWLGGACALLAVASKETGAAVLPAILALHAALAPAGTARIRFAARRSLPALGAVAGFLVLRTAVLDGFGGHPESAALAGLLRGVATAPGWLLALVMPQPWTGSALDAPLALLLCLAVAVATRSASREVALHPQLWALAAWGTSLLLLMGISGVRASWYLVPLLGPFVLLLGVLARHSRAPGVPKTRGRAVAALCGVLLLGVAGTSPLLRDYPAWRQVSRDVNGFLARFDAAVEAAPLVGRTNVPGLPLGTGAPSDRIGVRSALGMTGYSAAAYAELRFPDRRIDVIVRGVAAAADDPRALTVEVDPSGSPLAAGSFGAQP